MSRTAISLGNTKESALYFDHVVPLFLTYDIALEEEFDVWKATDTSTAFSLFSDKRNKFLKLLPDELHEGTPAFDKFLELNMQNLRTIGVGGDVSDHHDKDTYMRDVIRDNLDRLNMNVNNFLKEVPMSGAALTTSEIAVSGDVSDGDEIAVTLSGLGLVDTSKLSIEHLIEFRQDTKALAALRQLRVFAQKEYAGKPRSYIEDDLLSRIYHYEQAAKKWNFELANAGLTTLFNSKTAIGTVGGTIAAVMAGSPVIATSAAIVGTVLEIGKVTLSISKKRFEARKALGDNPVSYIVHAQSQLNS